MCRRSSLGAIPADQAEELVKEANLTVAEVYSPPRVTRAARLLPKLGVTPGFAMDITVNDEDGKP